MPDWWRSAPMVSSDAADFPSSSGQFIGSLGILAGAALTISAFWASGTDEIRMIVGGVFLVVGSFAFLIRPRISVRDGMMRVVDPLIVTEIPLGLIKTVWVGAVAYVQTREPDGRRFTGVALRRKRSDLGGTKVPSGVYRTRIVSMMPPSAERTWNTPELKDAANRVSIADAFEEVVSQRVADEQRRHPDSAAGLLVRRQISWALVVPMVMCVVVFAATYFR